MEVLSEGDDDDENGLEFENEGKIFCCVFKIIFAFYRKQECNFRMKC